MATNDSENPPKVLKGKVIAVTGAARGIGFTTARYLVKRGATVLLSDVLEAELKKAGDELAKEGEVSTAVVDITSRELVEGWLKGEKEKYRRLDAAVNNAGMSISGPIATFDDAAFDRIIAVNLKGTFNCLRAEIPLIEDGGSIVNVASAAGLHGIALLGPYCAAKHGVVGLTKTAAKEVAERSVRVNAVSPGAVSTAALDSMNKETQGTYAGDNANALSSLKRYGKPEDIASMIGFLVGDESTFITGSVYRVDGGWTMN